jgi:hypothetical protein
MEDKKNDDGLVYQNNRELFYSFDKERGYQRKVDYQYSANQTIIKQGWDVVEERLEEVRKAIQKKELSPIAWYMEKNLMEVPMLAAYSGISAWRVRRHLRYKPFLKLTPKLLKCYADTFNIPVGELADPPFLNHSHNEADNS